MKYLIEIPQKDHLVAWVRFIEESRPTTKLSWLDSCEFDFRKVQFLQPYHLTSLACLIEEYKLFGAKRIRMKTKPNTELERFLRGTSFDRYWKRNFDRDFCLKSEFMNVLPIWQFKPERIDPFANLTERFYANHCLPEKDLSPLRFTVVEALNNINDHSLSKIGGFIFTQYYNNHKELVISICDFGVGIPTKVNSFLARTGQKKLAENKALEKALEQGFSTRSTPNNRGYGLDTILSNVEAAEGQIEILSNRAFYWCRMNKEKCTTGTDNIKLNFKGTYLVIRLKTSKFLKLEKETNEEVELF